MSLDQQRLILRLTELLTSHSSDVFSQGLELLRAASSPTLLTALLEGAGAEAERTIDRLINSIFFDKNKLILRDELITQLHNHAASLQPRRLRLGYLKLPADTLHTLLSSMDLSRLVELDLRYNTIEAGLLFTDGLLRPGLERLYLQHSGLDEAAMQLLARCSALQTLRLLDLRYNPIGAGGARALASSENLGALQTLRLNMHDISPEGAALLADSAALPLAIRRSWRR